MDLSSVANWTQILAVVVPAGAAALIWLFIRPIKQDITYLGQRITTLETEVKAHDGYDVARFRDQESNMDVKLSKLRTELDEDRKDAFNLLRGDFNKVSDRLDDLQRFLMAQADRSGVRTGETDDGHQH